MLSLSNGPQPSGKESRGNVKGPIFKFYVPQKKKRSVEIEELSHDLKWIADEDNIHLYVLTHIIAVAAIRV